MHSGNYEKAIVLLDEATKIDSNFYTAFANKLSFQLDLDQLDNALKTAKNLDRIKPQSPDYYGIVGIIYYKKGDTISSLKYFKDAQICIDKILDTMSKGNKYYDNVLLSSALNLIIIGQQQKGDEILKELYNKESFKGQREFIATILNKSKNEILDIIINGTSSSVRTQ
jgi:tetratricopeptide (TPR) repeat protein